MRVREYRVSGPPRLARPKLLLTIPVPRLHDADNRDPTMKNLLPISVLVSVLFAACSNLPQTNPNRELAWPSFHGRDARGVADGYTTPTKWNVESGENIKWKTKIPGMAHSSPILWGDRLYVTTAVRDGDAELKVGLYGSIGSVENEGPHKFQLLSIDRNSGEIIWTKTAWEGLPKIKRHPKGSHAASSPATDGTHVAAFFGTEGLYVYNTLGDLLWKRDFGVLDSGFFRVKTAQWGFASSPVIHDGRLYVQCDVQDNSFIAAFDVKTGDEIWRTKREDVCSWGTPTVDVSTERHQLVVNGFKHIGGYDIATGKELWKTKGGGDIPVPTPIVAHGLVFITSAHGRASPILAISTSASGEFPIEADKSEHMVWSQQRGGNYMQTPVVYGDEFYGCRDNGIVSCIDAKTGKRHYRKRLTSAGGGFSASGVAADGKLYFPSEEGEIYVVKAGKEFEILAINELGENCMASPAISAGTLYFRTRGHLIAIAAPAPK
jgi:outer membrane protein assembly factor BamB